VKVTEIDAASVREITPGVAVSPRFPGRWSPRAMAGTALARDEIEALLEAARWAPSCFNAQPWRFAYVLRGSNGWQSLFETLVEGNQAWAQRAGALIAVISRTEYEHNGEPAPTHGFDAGAAWMSLALQAFELGLVAHGMRGFDVEAARLVLAVPDVYEIHAIIAAGHPGDIGDLPEAYQEREKPTPRKALSEIAFEHSFEELKS
jgi:nitroreductase